MDKSIVNIINNFGTEGDLLVAGKRNVIKTFPYNSIILNIKSFNNDISQFILYYWLNPT